MTTTDPLVSIVLPTYNGSRFLAESIESCLAQTYANWELVLVDDASTDDTPRIAQAYAARDARIRYFRNAVNSKLPRSLNFGFSQARGELLTWTSDDNRYLPTALAEFVAYLDVHREIDFVYSDYELIDDDGREVPLADGGRRAGEVWELPCRNVVGASFMYRRRVQEALGGYAEDLFLVEDYDFWLRTSRGFGVAFLDRKLYHYRQHAGSLSVQRAAQVRLAAERCISRHLPHLRWVAPRERVAAYGTLVDYALLREDRVAAAGYAIRAAFAAPLAMRAFGAKRLLAIVQPRAVRAWRLRRRLSTIAAQVSARVPADRVLFLLDDGQWGVEALRRLGWRVEAPSTAHLGAAVNAQIVEQIAALAATANVAVVVGEHALWRLEAEPTLLNYLEQHGRCLVTERRFRVFDVPSPVGRRERLVGVAVGAG